MMKVYKGNNLAIILEALASVLLCLFIAVPVLMFDKKDFWVYCIYATLGIIWILIITFVQFNRMTITIDENQIIAHNAILGSRNQFNWREIKSIHYYPLLCNVNICSTDRHRMSVTYLVKDYKYAWRDMVLQARENNPNVQISPSLIKKLEKSNLL